MAQGSGSGDEVRLRQRIHDDHDELGRFAHRLSLDVTNEALNFAAQNGAIQSIVDAEPNASSSLTNGPNAEHTHSLPATPGCSFRLSDHDISYDDCKKRKHRSQSSSRNPVGRIRDVSRSIAKWLRIRSKSISGIDGADGETHQEHPWRLWGKFGKLSDPRKRALPPVPSGNNDSNLRALSQDNANGFRLNYTLPGLTPGDAYMPDNDDDEEYEHEHASSFDYNAHKGNIDFAVSIEKVKDYGWYWGPISGEAAEMLLMNEPDGSFVVRDSSDSRYIFSLTFKLHGTIRHVRIEHNQGNFSFGSFTKFKSNTIVDFIENAVEHSRSGRYLFFLHRRPVFGPMQVQLLHPVSRFKQVQSLQHLSRFVILKLVPRDLLSQLPVPKRIQVYLDTPFYYSEAVADWTKDNEQQRPQSNAELEHSPSQPPQAPPPQDDSLAPASELES